MSYLQSKEFKESDDIHLMVNELSGGGVGFVVFDPIKNERKAGICISKKDKQNLIDFLNGECF